MDNVICCVCIQLTAATKVFGDRGKSLAAMVLRLINEWGRWDNHLRVLSAQIHIAKTITEKKI